MAKGNRKRSNKTIAKKKPIPISATKDTITVSADDPYPKLAKQYPVRPLTQPDVDRFKNVVTLSNNVAGLMKQIADAELSIRKGQETAKEMMSGKVKGPALQKVSGNLFLPLVDMKDVGRKIKGEIDMIKQATIISRGQLQQRYDEYVDTLRNMDRLFQSILAKAPKETLTNIKGDRSNLLKKSKKEEKVIFEKEVDKLTKEDTEILKGIQADINKKKKGK